MKKDSIKTVLNIASPVAAAGALLLPPLVVVPIIASVYNEICSYWDSNSIKNRLQSFQDELEREHIEIEDFSNRISILEEHSQYIVRNNIKHLCLSAQPETTDALNKAIIDLVMTEPYGLPEHACEILQQCNADDIDLLQTIKYFLANSPKSEYKKQLEEHKENNQSQGIHGRSYAYGPNNTIFWKDFAELLPIGKPVTDFSMLLNLKAQKRDESGEVKEEYIDFACLARSIIKMQSLGVLQCDFVTTIGTCSTNYIDRFHITIFGEKLLEYIEATDLDD